MLIFVEISMQERLVSKHYAVSFYSIQFYFI